MSYDILATPAAYSSFNGDLIYTVKDVVKANDPVTYPNFKYIADVYVDGSLVSRIKKVPDPTNGIGVFNLGQIVRNYVTQSFSPVAGVIVAQVLGDGIFNLSVQVKFGEEYSFTDTLNITVDSVRVFFNNYNRRFFGFTSSLTALADKVASNRTSTLEALFSSSYLFIPYFPTSTTPVSVTITPSSGGSVTFNITPDNAYDLQILNFAPQVVLAAYPGLVNLATTYYDVQIGAQTYRVYIICEAQYTPRMVHFLNQYGGFDSKIFTKVSRKTYDITKTDFGKLPYIVGADGTVSYKSANGVYNDSRTVYASQYVENALLNSDNLSDQEYLWLTDLLVSPMIYIEENGYFYPVLITDNSYEEHKNINDDVTNLTVNITYGNQLNTQFQ